jgi:hypothetical protein
VTRPTNAWAGTRFVPLPHESSFSAISRFAWQNVIDARTMKQLINGKRISSFSDSFLNLTWLSQSGLNAIANWDLPSVYEHELPASFPNSASLFFSKGLKICPLCFGAGFHSIWHQLILLNHCPLHKCMLVNNCQECGSLLGLYRFSKELFEAPYYCNSCRGPIAGAEFDLEDVLNQRQETASATSFDSIARWFKCARDELFLLQALIEGSSTKFDDDGGSQKLLALNIAHALHPFPHEFSYPAQAPRLTLLAWNIRARIANDTNFMSNRREIARCNANRTMARTIYSITLRKIQGWLVTFQTQSTLENAFSDFLTSRFLKLEQLDSATIAYILFRNCFELSPQFFSTRNFSVNGFRLDHSPPLKLFPYNEREPRLAYYAIYFGIYAGLYWRVEQACAQGKLKELTIGDLDSLLVKFLLHSEQRVAGGVIFRTIPNLPLPRALLCTLEDAKETLTMAEGFQAITGHFGGRY